MREIAPAGPRALLRLLGLLEAVAAAPGGLSLAELSQALASPKSSLLALLRPLVGSGHLLHETGRYRLGPSAFLLGEALLRARQPSLLIRDAIQEAWDNSGETVIRATIDRDAAVVTYVECHDSRQLVRYTVPAGSVRPLYCSAAGQALLASQPVAWRDDYLRHAELRKLAPATVTDLSQLRARLDRIRADGLSISDNEAVPGAAGLALPVLMADGRVNECILVAGPAERIRQRVPELRAMLLGIGERLAAAMGARPESLAESSAPASRGKTSRPPSPRGR